MRIVCIAASFVPSNAANSIQVMKAAHALAELGHEVTLLVPGHENAPWDALQDHYGLQVPFQVEWIPENLTFKRYDYAFKAVRRAKQLSPDLVYTWVLQAAVFALGRGLPALLELHDRVTGRMGPWLFNRFWRSKTPQRVLTNTQALKDVLIETFGLSEKADEILVGPNGVELERYQDLPDEKIARKELGVPEGFTAGYTGHFYAGRGMELMLALAKALPEVNFLWVGGQPGDVAQWQQRLADEGVHNITLTGFVDNAILPRYQAAADVLLMPYGTQIAGSGGGNSAEIASPMKMFEYMAAGRAIIASDLPVIHEVLNEEMAVFCPPEDEQAWQQAIRELATDPARSAALASAAKAAVSDYTWTAREAHALAGMKLNK
ncbi:glycosyltransferase [Chloroflexota bacterium]|nr:glycosyltransferase [Chloroflexota bacterium]